MKRVRLLRVLLPILAAVLSCSVMVYIAYDSQTKITFDACMIYKNTAESLLVYKDNSTEKDRLIYVPTKGVSISGAKGKKLSVDAISLGQMIEVTAYNSVLLTWPGSYYIVYKIKVTGEINDALYQEGEKAAYNHLHPDEYLKDLLDEYKNALREAGRFCVSTVFVMRRTAP